VVARWFAVHVEPAAVSLHRADAASVADVSTIHAASVFRAEMITVFGYGFWSSTSMG
jgi:hypothetical protein